MRAIIQSGMGGYADVHEVRDVDAVRCGDVRGVCMVGTVGTGGGEKGYSR